MIPVQFQEEFLYTDSVLQKYDTRIYNIIQYNIYN